MPKGFSEREKEFIQKKLIEKGKECLETYGIQKTNVEDLTRAVGISKGSFYIFYNSKEELFFEIIEGIQEEFRNTLSVNLSQGGKSPKENFKGLLRGILSLLDTNPILKNFSMGEYEYLFRKLPGEKIQAHMKEDEEFSARIVEKWQKEGFLIGYDPKVIMGLFLILIYTSFHKKDIGEDVYPATLELLIDSLANYLIKEK